MICVRPEGCIHESTTVCRARCALAKPMTVLAPSTHPDPRMNLTLKDMKPCPKTISMSDQSPRDQLRLWVSRWRKIGKRIETKLAQIALPIVLMLSLLAAGFLWATLIVAGVRRMTGY